MISCRKKVVVYFGLIAVAAILFVPYHERRVTSTRAATSVLVRRVTTESRGFMLLPRFLKLRGRTVSETTGAEMWVALNARLFKGEVAAIVILGLFDFFLVCGWRGRNHP